MKKREKMTQKKKKKETMEKENKQPEKNQKLLEAIEQDDKGELTDDRET